MLKKILAIIAYGLLFLLSTLLFAYFMFPLDKMGEYIEAKANTSPRYRLEIGSIEREGLGSLILSDVTLGLTKKLIRRKAAAAAPPAVPEKGEGGGENTGESKEAEEFTFIDVSEIRIDFSLLELLNPSHVSLGINVDLLGGFIEDGKIEFVRQEGRMRTAVNLPSIGDLQLGDTEFFAGLFSALLPSMKTDKVSGYLAEGSILMEPQWDEGDEAGYYTGQIDIELGDIVALSPILIQRMKKTKESVEVPLTDMRLGKCAFKLRVDRKDRLEQMDKVKTKYETATVVLFEDAECKGESLDYYIRKNSFILFPPKASLGKGRIDFWTKLAFNPDYFDKERKDELGVPETRNKELGQGLEFDRVWQRAQDVDGFYWMHCRGTFTKPKCRRGLPPEEKRRKKALTALEKKKKKADKKAAAKKKAAKKKADKKSKKAVETEDKKKRKTKVPSHIGARKTPAQERADKRRKEREEKRKKTTLRDLKTPSPPDHHPSDLEPAPEEDDSPDDEGEGEYEEDGEEDGEEGEEEGLEEGVEGEDEEGRGEEDEDEYEEGEGEEGSPAEGTAEEYNGTDHGENGNFIRGGPGTPPPPRDGDYTEEMGEKDENSIITPEEAESMREKENSLVRPDEGEFGGEGRAYRIPGKNDLEGGAYPSGELGPGKFPQGKGGMVPFP